MNGENVNSLILKMISVKPIAFNPELARIAGSATAGLFLSQLLYWWNKGSRKDCIYKTIKDFEYETCLTRSEQNRAIKIWTDLGVLKVKNEGLPRKRHFYIDTEKLIEMLEKRAEERGLKGHYVSRN